jgi:hypothetical protein
MKNLSLKFKNWWNHICFWGHEYEIAAVEDRAVGYKCENCGKAKLVVY